MTRNNPYIIECEKCLLIPGEGPCADGFHSWVKRELSHAEIKWTRRIHRLKKRNRYLRKKRRKQIWNWFVKKLRSFYAT